MRSFENLDTLPNPTSDFPIIATPENTDEKIAKWFESGVHGKSKERELLQLTYKLPEWARCSLRSSISQKLAS